MQPEAQGEGPRARTTGDSRLGEGRGTQGRRGWGDSGPWDDGGTQGRRGQGDSGLGEGGTWHLAAPLVMGVCHMCQEGPVSLV